MFECVRLLTLFPDNSTNVRESPPNGQKNPGGEGGTLLAPTSHSLHSTLKLPYDDPTYCSKAVIYVTNGLSDATDLSSASLFIRRWRPETSTLQMLGVAAHSLSHSPLERLSALPPSAVMCPRRCQKSRANGIAEVESLLASRLTQLD